MLKTSRQILITVLACLALTCPTSADESGFIDDPGKRLTVLGKDGKPVASYEYAYELDENGKVTFDTAKVFWHVIGPDGEEPLTKGPGGKFPHHRGIYLGWNKLMHDGKRHDLWHVKNASQKHLAFVKKEKTDSATTVATTIDWIGTEGKSVLKETRTVTVHHETGGAYAMIDVVSVLSAEHGEVHLGGDPEHAGIQYRASQKVAENKSAKYVFPVDDAKAKKYADLPWAAKTSEINSQKWTVQQMSHPDNPGENKRWSAYRDYGRFGEFPTIKIAEGEKATLRYRFRVTKGDAPTREELTTAYRNFAD